MNLQDFSKRIMPGIDIATPEERAIFVLIWLGFDVAKQMNGTGPATKLTELIKLAVPQANKQVLNSCLTASKAIDFDEVAQAYKDEAKAVLPPAVVIVSLVGLLSGEVERTAMDRIHIIAKTLDVDPMLIELAEGWRKGTANAKHIESFEAMVASWASASRTSAAVLRQLQRIPRTENVDFVAVRKCLQSKLPDLLAALDVLHVEATEVRSLQDALANDRFRLSVIGEFKRGKSTLINALLGYPDLMPTDTLPCTSALTEIQFGEKFKYEESSAQGHPGTFELREKSDFRLKVGEAKKTHRKEDAESVAEKIPYWRVHCPTKFLEESSIALIDSPGLGEDYARDMITKREAKRADAAILVFDPRQPASLNELELIDEMGTHAENLFIVMNRSDELDRSEWPRVQEHVLQRVKKHSETDFTGRIHFLSARHIENELKFKNTSDWTVEFDQFKNQLTRHLISQVGAIRVNVLRFKVDRLTDEVGRQVEKELATRKALLEQHEGLNVAKVKAETKCKLAEEGVKNAFAHLRDVHHNSLAKELYESFRNIQFGPAMNKAMDGWKTTASIIRPKKLAEEIGHQAQATILELVKSWSENTASEIVSKGIANAIEQMARETEDLRAYLDQVGGLSNHEYLGKLQSRTLKTAFGGVEIDSAEIGLKGALAGVLSLIIGYVIADIILFYILSIVTGFLNPFLLATAVVVAIPAALLSQEFVKTHIKTKIISKIEEKLREGDALDKVREGFEVAMKEVFTSLAFGFKESAEELLQEVRRQSERTHVQMEEFLKTFDGDPTSKSRELARLRELATQTHEMMKEMKGCIP